MAKYRAELPENSLRVIIEEQIGSCGVPLVNAKGARRDGRNASQLRPVFLKMGVVHAASGSAYVEQRNTKVVCSVFGPRPVAAGQKFSPVALLNFQFKYATFAKRDKRTAYLQDETEMELSTVLQEAVAGSIRVEQYPKSQFDVFVLVLEDDGSATAAAISAASLAFANAGVEMYDLVASCSSAMLSPTLVMPGSVGTSKKAGDGGEDGSGRQPLIVLDPSWMEEHEAAASLLLAYSPSVDSLSQVHQTGSMGHAQLLEAVDLTTDACSKLYAIMKQTLVQSVTAKS